MQSISQPDNDNIFKNGDLNLDNSESKNRPVEGDWNDEEDEDFDDETENTNDLHEIQVDDDLGEPDPEDDDHLPDDDLQ